MDKGFSYGIRNRTRFKLPKIFWRKIKSKILGADYDLSLVFISDKEMTGLNRRYRGKSQPTNVLSFSLEEKSGEVFVALPLVLRQAHTLNKTPYQHILDLYIHALLHLNGFKHNTGPNLQIMKKAEQKWLKILS